MKKMRPNYGRLLFALLAGYSLGFIGHASADPGLNNSPEYVVTGSTVVGSGINPSGAFFFDGTTAGYTITVTAGSNLGNEEGNEIEFDHGSVTNSGTLSAQNVGIAMSGSGSVTNQGSIISESNGVQVFLTNSETTGNANTFNLNNSGVITASNLGTYAQFTNSGNSGTNSNSYIFTNTGSITTVGNNTVALSLVNQNNTGDSNANTVEITNTGMIGSTDGGTGLQSSLSNTGNSGSAQNTVTANNSGDINGEIQAIFLSGENQGNGGTSSNVFNLTNSGSLSSSNGEGIFVSGDNSGGTSSAPTTNTATIINSGPINSSEGIDVALTNHDNASSGVNTLNLTNSGSIITSNSIGISLDAEAYDNMDIGTSQNVVTLNNSGTINSYATSLELNADTIENNGAGSNQVTITNTGSLTSADEFGIFLESVYNQDNEGTGTNTVSITNAGEINSSEDGIFASVYNSGNNGPGLNVFTVINSGTLISGGGITTTIENDGNRGAGLNINQINIANSGFIRSQGGQAFYIQAYNSGNESNGSNALTITNTGTVIATDSSAINLYVYNENNSGAGVDSTTITVTNNGTIRSIGDGVGIQTYNDTSAPPPPPGPLVLNAQEIRQSNGIGANTVEVTNTGTIVSWGGSGIFVYYSGNQVLFGSGLNTNDITFVNSGTVRSEASSLDIESISNYKNSDHGSNTISISNFGPLLSWAGQGIYLEGIYNQKNGGTGANTNTITVTNSGTVTAAESAIEVDEIYNQGNLGLGANNVTIVNNGDLLPSDEPDADAGISVNGVFNQRNTATGINTNTIAITNNAKIVSSNEQGINVNTYNQGNTGSGANNVTVSLGSASNINASLQGVQIVTQNKNNMGTTLDSNTVTVINQGFITSSSKGGVHVLNQNRNSAGDASNSITVINTGDIEGATRGVNLRNLANQVGGNSSDSISLFNDGTIHSTGNYGADLENNDDSLESPGSLTGAITVVNGANGSIVGDGRYGVYISNSGFDYSANVTNSGTISGARYGVYFDTNLATLLAVGGTISGGTDSVNLNGSNSNVTVLGRATFNGKIEGNDNTGNTLDFKLAGMTPAQIAAAKEAIAAADGGPGQFTAGGKTYNFDGFLAGNIAFEGVSFQQSVDSGLRDLGAKLDTGALPDSMDIVYTQGWANPEATLNQLSGREFLDAFSQIGLNNATQFASAADTRAFALRSGSTGIDFSALTMSPNTMIASLGNMQTALNRMSGPLLAGGTEMSDSVDNKAMISSQSPRWGAWAAGTVTFADQSTTSTTPGYNSTSGSPTFGVDYRICPELVIGALFNYTTGNVNFGDGSNLNTDTYLGGIYLDWTHKGWFINALAAGGKSDYSQNRVTLGGATAQASPGGGEELATLATGYDFKTAGFVISPEVGLQYTHLNKGAFSESGAGAFDLNVGDEDVDSLRTKLGLNLSRPFTFSGIKFVPQANAFWYHECLDNTTGVSNSLAGAPALGSFVVQTNAEGRDFALVGAGVNATPDSWNGNVSFFLNYEAQVGQANFISNTVDGGVRVGF